MIEMNPQNKNKLVLHYDMTLACNLRCSYCFKLPELDNKKLFLSLKKIKYYYRFFV